MLHRQSDHRQERSPIKCLEVPPDAALDPCLSVPGVLRY